MARANVSTSNGRIDHSNTSGNTQSKFYSSGDFGSMVFQYSEDIGKNNSPDHRHYYF